MHDLCHVSPCLVEGFALLLRARTQDNAFFNMWMIVLVKASVTGGDAQQGPAKGSDFRAEALKGLHFSGFSRLGAKGSQCSNTDGTKQKLKKSCGHFCCFLLS